jgi:hypothetical protein
VVNGGGGAAPEGLDEDGQVAVALDALDQPRFGPSREA